MANPATAAYDPIFYLHRAYVDYVWELFRLRQRRRCDVNPLLDYPDVAEGDSHHPNAPMTGFDWLVNRDGIAGYWNENWYRYDMHPICHDCCPNCQSPSPMFCDRSRNVCVSRSRRVFPFLADIDVIPAQDEFLEMAEIKALVSNLSPRNRGIEYDHIPTDGRTLSTANIDAARANNAAAVSQRSRPRPRPVHSDFQRTGPRGSFSGIRTHESVHGSTERPSNFPRRSSVVNGRNLSGGSSPNRDTASGPIFTSSGGNRRRIGIGSDRRTDNIRAGFSQFTGRGAAMRHPMSDTPGGRHREHAGVIGVGSGIGMRGGSDIRHFGPEVERRVMTGTSGRRSDTMVSDGTSASVVSGVDGVANSGMSSGAGLGSVVSRRRASQIGTLPISSSGSLRSRGTRGERDFITGGGSINTRAVAWRVDSPGTTGDGGVANKNYSGSGLDKTNPDSNPGLETNVRISSDIDIRTDRVIHNDPGPIEDPKKEKSLGSKPGLDAKTEQIIKGASIPSSQGEETSFRSKEGIKAGAKDNGHSHTLPTEVLRPDAVSTGSSAVLREGDVTRLLLFPS